MLSSSAEQPSHPINLWRLGGEGSSIHQQCSSDEGACEVFVFVNRKLNASKPSWYQHRFHTPDALVCRNWYISELIRCTISWKIFLLLSRLSARSVSCLFLLNVCLEKILFRFIAHLNFRSYLEFTPSWFVFYWCIIWYHTKRVFGFWVVYIYVVLYLGYVLLSMPLHNEAGG